MAARNARFDSGSGSSIGLPSGWNIATDIVSASRAVTASRSDTGSTRLSRSVSDSSITTGRTFAASCMTFARSAFRSRAVGCSTY